MGTLASFIQKETRHILRDRQTVVVLLVLPVAMVLLFGYAIRTDVENVRLLVVDPSMDGRSIDLTQALAATPALRLVGVHPSSHVVETAFRSGTADVALLLPQEFARRLARGSAQVLILTDGTNPNYAQTTEAYVRAATNRWLALNGGGPIPIQLSTRMRFNPTLESQNLLVPGLLAFVLALVSALMTAITIAREKERGTMEVLLVSPLRPIEIVLGKVAPYVVLAFLNALSVLAIAWLVFQVPVRGSLFLLLAMSFVYVLVSLAVGVLISVKMPDQRTAMVATLLGLLFPTIILSGFIFPISSLPAWLQPFSRVIPATYYIVITRGVMLKDVGLDILWKECLVLLGMAFFLIAVSVRSLKDRI